MCICIHIHIYTHIRTLCASEYMLCVCVSSVHEYMLCVCGNVCVLCICCTMYLQAQYMYVHTYMLGISLQCVKYSYVLCVFCMC